MRKKFEQQLSIGSLAISNVKIPDYKRDELPPTLQALQYIFITPELNQEIFSILELAILKGKKKTGRQGMELWHILVLGVVRMTLDLNYDRLWHTANYDLLVRQVMGVCHESNSGISDTASFAYTTIRENIQLLDETTIEKISEIIVKGGHQLLKKKEEKLIVKADTYVLESNVHFPTDINLLFDASRKCLDIVDDFKKILPIDNWRKLKLWQRSVKNQCRTLSKVCQSGGKDKDKRVFEQATEYLRITGNLQEKVLESIIQILSMISTPIQMAKLISLEYYHQMMVKHIDLVERRLINNEIIPHAEKLFSIFETHAEWIKKGKANNKVEIGHKILIATDQFDFILTHKVIEHQEDVVLSIPLVDRLLNIYGENIIGSISFDKGFWKKENKDLLQLFIDSIVMPKKGNKNKQEQEEESNKQFKKLRNKHSAVESNINCLEHHGLNRCPDKGIMGFKKYTAMGILAYNLHKLGNAIMALNEKKKEPLKVAA